MQQLACVVQAAISSLSLEMNWCGTNESGNRCLTTGDATLSPDTVPQRPRFAGQDVGSHVMFVAQPHEVQVTAKAKQRQRKDMSERAFFYA